MVRCGALALAAVAIIGCDPESSAPVASNTTVAIVIPTTWTIAPESGPAAPGPTATGQTLSPATTIPPLEPATETLIRKAVQDFFKAYMACGQAPATCHAADFHSGRGTAVGQGTVYFQGLTARGEYFGPDLRGSYIVTQSIALENATAAITFSCWYDASILLGPVDSTGQPAVLNDKIISVREKQELFFDGQDWKVGEAATVEDLGDGNQCPPPDSPAP